MKYLPLLVVTAISFQSNSQYYHKRDTVPGAYLRQVTISLSPIVIHNGKYFFDCRRVKFEEMLLPLVSVDDQSVDHRLKVVRTLKDLRPVINNAGFVYTTYLASHVPPTQGGLNTLLNNLIGVYVFRVLYDVGISLEKRSAINRYNKVVLQKRDSIPGNNPRQITFTLSPIVIQNSKYFFEGRNVTFEEMALALIAVHDKIVDHRLKVVRTLTDLRPVFHYAGVAYTTYLAFNLPGTRSGLNTFIVNAIGVFAFQMLYDGSIQLAKRSTINRYNDVVLTPSAGITPAGGLSLGFRLRF